MKNKYFLLLIVIIILSYVNVYAESKTYVTLTADDVIVRQGPSTSYKKITNVSLGDKYYLLNNEKILDEGTGCSEGWYNINYNDNSGYICSRFVSVTTVEIDENCKQSMISLGFPEDYSAKLCDLKETHPTWSFVPIITNLDWNTVVNKESACGKSYISTSNPDYIDTSCKSAYSQTSSWKVASKTAVAYYLDPRNWLNEQSIFQFNTNKYEESLTDSYVTLSTNTISSTDFYTYHLGVGNNMAEIITQAGKETNVSPIFLSSRMIQELGSKTSERDLYSGVYTGHESQYLGYYNFFNIGVSDACATTNGVAYCGLSYAKNKEWSSPFLAVKGGSLILSNSYINVGQYTTYFQKFNVVPTVANNVYLHQYMTNVAAPSSEAKTAYLTYKKSNALESAFVFYIPVYNNMSEEIKNDVSGAVEDKTESVDNKSSSDVSTIVTSVGYKYLTNKISGFQIGSNVNDILNNLVSIAGEGNVSITDRDNTPVSDTTIKTGYKISITNKSGTTTLSVIVKGDTSGDGEINALDLLQVQKSILKTYTLNDEFYNAGDTSGDGEINALDLLQIQKSILGTYEIVQ